MVGTPASYVGGLEFDCLHGYRLSWKRCRGIRQSRQVFFSMAQQPLGGLGHLICPGFTITLS
jgi:hypothetical protein